MIEKRTIVDQIEIVTGNVVQIRIGLIVADGEDVIARQWHRTAVEPGDVTSEKLEILNHHIAQMGYPRVPDDGYAMIERIVSAANG